MSEFEAEKELRIAVANLLQAYGIANGFITELTVVCAQQYFDGEGAPHTVVTSLWPDNPPHYRRLGLLEYESTRLRSVIECTLDLDEDYDDDEP